MILLYANTYQSSLPDCCDETNQKVIGLFRNAKECMEYMSYLYSSGIVLFWKDVQMMGDNHNKEEFLEAGSACAVDDATREGVSGFDLAEHAFPDLAIQSDIIKMQCSKETLDFCENKYHRIWEKLRLIKLGENTQEAIHEHVQQHMVCTTSIPLSKRVTIMSKMGFEIHPSYGKSIISIIDSISMLKVISRHKNDMTNVIDEADCNYVDIGGIEISKCAIKIFDYAGKLKEEIDFSNHRANITIEPMFCNNTRAVTITVCEINHVKVSRRKER